MHRIASRVSVEKEMLSSVGHTKSVFFSSPSPDNFLFELCSRWTALLLVAFSFVVTCKLAFGHSFSCVCKDPGKSVTCPGHVNVQCYARGTYTDPAELFVHRDVLLVDSDVRSPELRRYQSHYQWVNLVLIGQALAFHLPLFLWKSYERGHLSRLTARSDPGQGSGSELLARYVLATQGKHRTYALVYAICEAGHFLVAVALTTCLVGFFDVTGVPERLPLELHTWGNFRDFYFPSSGTCEVEGVPYVCEMPLNALYMAAFLFLHAWYIVLSVLAGLVLLYRIALLSSPFRQFVTRNASFVERSVLKSLCRQMAYGDWFFLTRLQKYLSDHEFAQMLDKMTILSQIKGDRQG